MEDKNQGNELIALFDGWDLITSAGMGLSYFRKDGRTLLHSELNYDSDWRYLMAVWYRFVDLRYLDVMHQLKHSELKTTCGYAILYGGIDLAYNRIIDAIKWHNSLT